MTRDLTEHDGRNDALMRKAKKEKNRKNIGAVRDFTVGANEMMSLPEEN